MVSSSSRSCREPICSRLAYPIPVRRRRMKAALFVAGVLIACSTVALTGQRGGGAGQANPSIGNPQAIAEGETLYNKTCATCHGANGGGGETGPALVLGDRMDIGRSDGQAYSVIKNGVAGTPMKPLGLRDADI